MNDTIDHLLQQQKYDVFDHNVNIQNIDIGHEEAVLTYNHINHNINIITHETPNMGSMQRLQIILPYLQKFFYTYQDNIKENFTFMMHLGDGCGDRSRLLPYIAFVKAYWSNAILIPNIDFFTGSMINYFNTVQKYDINYENKIDGSIFSGASTGPIKHNKRIKYCLSISEKNEQSHKATMNLCQHSKQAFENIYGNITKIIGDPISIEEQLKYKILINIDGNTICYSRLFWQMYSNSISIYFDKSRNDLQLFDLYDYSQSYFHADIESYWALIQYILNTNNSNKIKEKISNGKKYMNLLFNDYMRSPQEYLQDIINFIFNQLVDAAQKVRVDF